MKKVLLSMGIVVFSAMTIYAQQSAYYDAMFIYENCFDQEGGVFIKRQDLFAALQKYYPPGTLLSESKLRENPFFKDFVPDVVAQSIGGTLFKEATSSIGSLNVTNFADGLAKFLVARAKEELNVAFFRKFQEFIQKYPEVQTIFPSTYAILSKIYSYQYTMFLPALRAGFQKDMNSFSAHFIELRDLTPGDCHDDANCKSRINGLTSFLNDHPVGKTFVAALIVSDNVVKGNNPAEILDAIERDRICFEQNDNFSNIIHFSNLVSNSLRSKEAGEIWVSKDEINALVKQDIALRIYLGLLFELNKLRSVPIVFTMPGGGSLSFADLLTKASVDLGYFAEVKNNLREFGNLAAQTSLFAKQIRSRDGENNESSIMVYADFVSSLSSLLKQAVTFFDNQNPQLAKDVKLFTSIIDDATDACYDIKSQNYTALVLHTSDILNVLHQDSFTYKDDYIKYGTFMANIIEADNSDEVKAAIEGAVLPVGSSSIKRETFSNISLNAYIGPMVGMEYLPGLNDDQMAPVVGITAPLGLAFNWGNIGNGKRNQSLSKEELLKKSKHAGQSLSLFIPLIDVGALATFRIGDDSSHVASEVKLANIVAPGIYGYWGLGKVPVSIGLGGQIGPQLRKINAEEVNVDKNFYVRFGLHVVVDIPFFNFYTRN